MYTPDYLAARVDLFMPAYERYQTSLINEIAKRMIKGGADATNQWLMDAYLESGGVFDDAIIQLAELTASQRDELLNLFVDCAIKATSYDDTVYRTAGLNPIPLRQSKRSMDLLLAGLERTQNTLQNLVRTTAVTSQQAFIQAADRASFKVLNGGMSYQQVIADEVARLAETGLYVYYPPKVPDGKGHRDKIDVAVRRAVLTSVNQTVAEVRLARIVEMGLDLVEVTAHSGAREGEGIANHVGWQGGVYSLSGTHPIYPSFYKVCGYGQGDGICGWNCRHNFHVFVEGVSRRVYTDEELQDLAEKTVTYNGKEMSMYKATQKQREMERGIRATKRELSALNTAIGATDDSLLKESLQKKFAQASVKLKKQEAEYKDFSAQTGIFEQKDRLRTQGFGRSESSKAVWANRKANTVAPAKEMVGIQTPNGITISKSSIHISEKMAERGVTMESVQKALQNPLDITKIKVDDRGRRSLKYIGENATVAVNPDTGRAITVHGTHTKLVNKLKQRKEEQ